VTLESNTDPVSSPFVGVKSIARGGLRRAISHTRTIVVDYGLGAGYDHFAARGVVGRGRLASKLQSDVSSGTGPQRQSQLPSLPWLIYSKFQSERVGRALICYSFSQIYITVLGDPGRLTNGGIGMRTNRRAGTSLPPDPEQAQPQRSEMTLSSPIQNEVVLDMGSAVLLQSGPLPRSIRRKSWVPLRAINGR
jgi:hypothetical protein